MTEIIPLTRAAIAKILKRHSGAKAEVSRRAKVDPSLVYHWCRGRAISANVAQHAEAVARELLASESLKTKITEEKPNGATE